MREASVSNPITRLTLLPLALFTLGLLVFCWQLVAIPPGLNHDAARISVYTLDFIQRSVWPFYIFQHFAPTPLLSYLQAPVFLVFGYNLAAMRGLTAVANALTVPLVYHTARLALTHTGPVTSRRAGILAAIGFLTFAFWNGLARSGLEATLMPLVCMLTTAALWRGLRTGRRVHFIVAGIALGLSQYLYVLARALPIAIGFASLAAIIFQPSLLRQHWRGLALAAGLASLIALPQWGLFVTAPYTFFSRTEQAAGGWLFAQPNAWTLFFEKLLNQFLLLSWRWNSDYNLGSTRPWLTPILFAGFCIGIVAALRQRRPVLGFVVTALAVMLVPDLVTYEGVIPSATRLTGALAFMFVVAGVGCALAWEWLAACNKWAGYLVPLAVIAFGVESQLNYITQTIPAYAAEAGIEWKVGLVEIAQAGYVAAHPDTAFLIEASEYQRVGLAFLLAGRFPSRAGGLPASVQPGDEVVALTAVDPERPTSEGGSAGYIPGEWVLLKEGTAYMLPVLPDGFVPAGEAQEVTASNGLVVAHARPMQWTDTQPEVKPANVVFQNGLTLAGYTAGPLAAEAPIDVTLYWKPERPIENDAHMIVQIWDAHGNAVAAVHAWPFRGTYRLGAWQVGQVVPTSFRFNLPAGITPGAYRLMVGLQDLTSQKNILTQSGEALATVGVLKSPLPPSTFIPAHLLAASFGDSIQLNGYSVETTPGNLTLTLQWQTLSPPETDYTLFTHIVNNAGDIIAQADSQPVHNTYPTSIWSTDETITDPHTLPVPPGQYDVYIGLYRLDTGERLPISLNTAPVPDNRLLLTSLEIP